MPTTMSPVTGRHQTLDYNWETIKKLSHQMVDDMFAYLENCSASAVWVDPSLSAQKIMAQPLPLKGKDPRDIYRDYQEQILPFNTNNVHPRFWAWVQGGGTPLGMLADMLASGMNAHAGIGNHMPLYVDRKVLDWSKELFDFPQSASGLLTSGASIANITALLVARNSISETVKARGIRALPQMVVYGSSETHNCVVKAVEVIGLGGEHFRKVPVNSDFTVDVNRLEEMIQEDRAKGYLPLCIVGNAGTVNTGAIDDLAALAKIARRENVWFHIDGAFGAAAKLLPEYSGQLGAIAEADSLSFDFHKWFYVNMEVGCVLIKDAEKHRKAFVSSVDYLMHHERGLAAGPETFSNYGMELTRGFKALKVWMSFQEHGIEGYRRQIGKNVKQAQYLAQLVREHNQLELLADVGLNIVCFRFNPNELADPALNQLNKELLMRLQESGLAAPSYTILNGRYAIRVAITNHRSEEKDFNLLVQGVITIGQELIKSEKRKRPADDVTNSKSVCQ